MRLENEGGGGGENTCVCFVEYGLPHNAVYVPQSDETLYGPRIEARSDERVRVRSRCRFRRLLEKWNATGPIHAMPSAPTTAAERDESDVKERSKSGTVSFVDGKGVARRAVFGLPLFPCIEHCVSLYEQLVHSNSSSDFKK
jgi:hypothetical protein